MIKEIYLNTKSRTEMIDITAKLQDVVRDSGSKEGLCIVFVPHTTAAITVNENADPDVRADILTQLNKNIPQKGDWRHREGNADSHVKASLVGSSVTLIIREGQLNLGTWQGIFFCEFDGPRKRRVLIKITGSY
jgi:secondary thiamine-phosphate synthase enzyme